MKEKIDYGFSQQDIERYDLIPGKEDLLPTKLLRIKSDLPKSDAEKIFIGSRDKGSAKTLVPVMKMLKVLPGIELDVITDGVAEEVIRDEIDVMDITPEKTSLETDLVVGDPNLILVCPSTNLGIGIYAAGTYDEVPLVLVEDYYSSSRDFLRRVIDNNLPLPAKICVIDEEAKRSMIYKYPEVSDRVIVTGQPAFDEIAEEDTKNISDKVRQSLQLSELDKLVALMSTDEVTNDQVGEIVKNLNLSGTNYLAFRKHPADRHGYDEYYQIFNELGINYVDVKDLTVDEVGAATDLVVTTWSTEGLKGIYRQKPSIHILDKKLLDVPSQISAETWPPVKLGASLGLEDINDLGNWSSELLDPKSKTSEEMQKRMRKFYPADGKNTERVVRVAMDVLAIS